jgi:hypothetical protein
MGELKSLKVSPEVWRELQERRISNGGGSVSYIIQKLLEETRSTKKKKK